MKRQKLAEEPWCTLVSLLEHADSCSRDELTDRIKELSLEDEFSAALVEAIHGDNRAINKWLVTRPRGYEEPLVWLAPVLHNGQRRYVWMIGFQTPQMADLRERCLSAKEAMKQDPLLRLDQLPPFLLFVDLVKSSRFAGKEYRQQIDVDEFAIFQTNYQAGRTEVTDFEQQMILNTGSLVRARQRAFHRAEQLGASNLDVSSDDLCLFALAHTEGHNQAHFAGPWPWGEDKNTPLYEALEEYRSCVAAIRLAEHWGFSEEQLDQFAVSIFLVRFLEYGLKAYHQKARQRDAVREIMVGVMFFEYLRSSGAVSVRFDSETVALNISPRDVRRSLLSSLEDIHTEEAAARQKGGVTDLKELAQRWFGMTFPNGHFSHEAMAILDSVEKDQHHATAEVPAQ